MKSFGSFFIHRAHNNQGKVAIEIGMDTKKPLLVNAFSRSLAAVDHITVNYSAAEIVVRSTDRGELTMREYMLVDDESYYANVQENDRTLSINAGARPARDNLRIRIELDIPAAYHGRLEISSVSGPIKLTNLHHLRSLAISSTNGPITLLDLSMTCLTIDSVTGNIQGEDLTADMYTIDAMSGNVTLMNTKGTYAIHCAAGALKLNDAHGHGKFTVTSGSAKLAFTDVDGNLSAESSAGSVRLQVPRALAYSFNLETSIGSLKTPEMAHFANNERSYQTGAVGGPSDITISMLTVVGSLALEAR